MTTVGGRQAHPTAASARRGPRMLSMEGIQVVGAAENERRADPEVGVGARKSDM